MTSHHPGRFTIRTAGVLFLVSALFEAAAVGHAVPLFGAMRGGAAAAVYHVVFVALFAAVGAGLWRGSVWAPRAVYAATAVYTADKLQAVAFRGLLRRQIQKALAAVPGAEPLVDPGLLVAAAVAVGLVLIACWWGFAFYIYLRRDYFTPAAPRSERGSGG